MFRPSVDESQRVDQQEAKRISKERKDEARARILDKLMVVGEVSGSMEEIRAKLGLEDMNKRLFSDTCWKLRVGNPDEDAQPGLIMRRGGQNYGWESRPFILWPLSR
jgi:hypothetical protein